MVSIGYSPAAARRKSRPNKDTAAVVFSPGPMIDVSGFSKSYNGVNAVDALTFRVASGEILGMVGPNGAGKTTTLRALCGILPPTSGRLSIGGHDIERDPIPAKMKLAYLPDEPKLFDSLTVWEHLQFTASVYKVQDWQPRAEALIEKFQLSDHRAKLAEELSRGLRQRTAIVCAYLHDPTVICFDEPMVGLDPHGIRTLKESMRQEAARGAAVVLSSHMLTLVEDICSQLLILHKGRAVFYGSLKEAKERAASNGGAGSLEDFFFSMTGPV